MLGLLAVIAGVTSACMPPPATDADNAQAGVNPYGWFEADKEWRGDFGDPQVLYNDGTYYAYSSATNGRYLPVMTSTDLVHWYAHPRWTAAGPPWQGHDPNADSAIPAEIRASALSSVDKWNQNDGLVAPASWGLTHQQGAWINRDLWAPGVAHIGDSWYAYSAVRVSWQSDDPNALGRFCLTVSSAPSPLGPFRDISGGAPLLCDSDPAGSIDPSVYVDPNTNAAYLVWKAAGKRSTKSVRGYPSALKAQRLTSGGRLDPASAPVTLLTTDEASWEGQTIENPSMITWRGVTYLFYSGNSFTATDLGISNYATGYAICPQGPLGSCVRASASPLMASSGDRQGPGGASAFIDADGGLRLAYAAYWFGEKRSNTAIPHPRRLAIAGLNAGPMGTVQLAP
jgi:hypothetical protein